MRNFMLVVFLTGLSLTGLQAQGLDGTIKEGAVYVIGKASTNTYAHIHFPRPNFIIKRGGIATFKNLKGRKVAITGLTKDDKGQSVATITLVSGRYFFGSHKYVKVSIAEAIATKELIPA